MEKAGPREIDVFFYGLFMDAESLRAQGLHPAGVQLAELTGYALRIGRRATLFPEPGSVAHGVAMRLTHRELRQLYSGAGLEAYEPEAVLLQLRSDARLAALCFNLPVLPPPSEANPAYAESLRALAHRLGLPPAYIESIR